MNTLSIAWRGVGRQNTKTTDGFPVNGLGEVLLVPATEWLYENNTLVFHVIIRQQSLHCTAVTGSVLNNVNVGDLITFCTCPRLPRLPSGGFRGTGAGPCALREGILHLLGNWRGIKLSSSAA